MRWMVPRSGSEDRESVMATKISGEASDTNLDYRKTCCDSHCLSTFIHRCAVISSFPSGRTLYVPCSAAEGRYVTVALPGPSRALSLCEVEVYPVDFGIHLSKGWIILLHRGDWVGYAMSRLPLKTPSITRHAPPKKTNYALTQTVRAVIHRLH